MSLTLMAVINTTLSVCPDSSLLKPCSCNKDMIICGNRFQALDLVQIFQKLGKQLPKTGKHFNEFHLTNSLITELKENTFSDITFDTIRLHECPKLKTIHKNAFTTTDQITSWLNILDNPVLSSPDNSIFEAINKFANLSECYISDTNITEIPSNAFKNKQDQMKIISFSGKSIKKIGENVFSNFKNIERIDLIRTSIDFIPENTFESKEESNQTLIIFLFGNRLLNSSGLSEHSLTKFKRPTWIYLREMYVAHNWNNHFKYFDEKIFQPFFELNVKNRIISSYESVDCNDCRNYWLQKNPTLLKHIQDASCASLKTKFIDDPANFAKCKT